MGFKQRRYDNGDITAGVKRALNVALFILGDILLSVFFNVCTSTGPVDALKVQNLNSNSKAESKYTH